MYCRRLAGIAGCKKSSSWHHRTTLSGYIFATKARMDNRKNLLNTAIPPTCPHHMVNFGPLAPEICWRVWGIPANFNGFRILAALLHGTLVVGVNQTLRRRTKGATCILQGGHHVGNWPTFLVVTYFKFPIQVCFPCSARPARHRTACVTDILRVLIVV